MDRVVFFNLDQRLAKGWRRAGVVLVLSMVLFGGGFGGCNEASKPATALPPDLTLARQCNAQGVAARQPEQALALFRQAVAADPLYGPAQNNLGISLLKQGNYYEAAKAFEQAIRLLPHDPDPRVNLGLVYEAAGQDPNAQQQYEQALVVAPQHIEALQALARVQVRQGQIDAKTLEILRTLELQGNTEAWRIWARRQLLRFYGGTGEASTIPSH